MPEYCVGHSSSETEQELATVAKLQFKHELSFPIEIRHPLILDYHQELTCGVTRGR